MAAASKASIPSICTRQNHLKKSNAPSSKRSMSGRLFQTLLAGLVIGCCLSGEIPVQGSPTVSAKEWDTFSDTWVATDAVGRTLPGHEQVGPPRKDRTVGIFYFLWLNGSHRGGPYDVTNILAQDPDAMQKSDSPLWGPMFAPHHWGESIFNYYLTDDAGVLRKHAQMLSDANIDAVIFDVSNQLTYKPQYMELLRVFNECKENGGRPPQVAFLCPFWSPNKVVAELYRDLYRPGIHPELWFRWQGKPLIMADPGLLDFFGGNEKQSSASALQPGETFGQTFRVDAAIESVAANIPTWRGTGAATLKLFRDGPAGKLIASQRFEKISDNHWITLKAPSSPGTFYLELSEPSGRVGWWGHTNDVFAAGEAYVNGVPASGDRSFRFVTRNEETEEIRRFFTFRKPQPDYFLGQTQPDMWSWLEVHPQHVFTNSLGEKEQMSVGIGQNAVTNRLGSMSEQGAHGRSFHQGATDPRPNAVLHGFNVIEQWTRALKEDPRFIFLTGWNEWIAGRHPEFNGIRKPVMFVDQFDQEHSRDIEPMRGGHGDNYYYQMAGYVRRFKGARPLSLVKPGSIQIDGAFDDWKNVSPEFRDTIGDPMQRHHRGWDPAVTYTNGTGRNDLVVAKVSHNRDALNFHIQTREPLTSFRDTNWMLLLIDVDADAKTGWLGYDAVVNRGNKTASSTSLERNAGGKYEWKSPQEVQYRAHGNALEIMIPLAALGLKDIPPFLDFKWADNIQQTGDWSDFTLNGDVAPNDRFNYRAKFKN